MKIKINWLLILQGWTMLWVVIGHAFLGKHNEGPEWETLLGSIAYSFHMPLFMLISGWLFYLTRLQYLQIRLFLGGDNSTCVPRKYSFIYIIKDKALRLILPGFFFSFIAFVLKATFPGEMTRQIGFSLQDIIHSFLYPVDNPFQEIWFIVTLYWFFIFAPMWQLVIQKRWSIVIMILILLAIHFKPIESQLLSIDRVCIHAIWFFLGVVIAKENLVEIKFLNMPFISILTGAVVYIVGLYLEFNLLSSAGGFFQTVGGIVISFGIALFFDKRYSKCFFTFRNYTYQIFLMGIFAQVIVKILYRHMLMPYVGAYILCILMGVYVPVLVSKLIEKINWKPLLLCVGLKPIK